MEIRLEKKTEVEGQLIVSVAAQDYAPGVAKRVRSYASKARLSGFRKGHVPSAHIERLYGQQILVEEMQDLIRKFVGDYIEKEKLKTLGEPLLIHADPLGLPEEKRSYTFNYLLGFQSEPKIHDIQSLSYMRYRMLVKDEDVFEYVENLRDRLGTMTHPAQVSGDNMLLIGEWKPSSTEPISLRLSLSEMTCLGRERLEGLGKGEQRLVAPAALYDKDKLPATLRKVAYQHKIDLAALHPFELKEIDLLVSAAIAPALFEKVFPQNPPKDEETFRARCKEVLEKEYDAHAQRHLFGEIKESFIERYAPTLPHDYLQKRFQQNLPEDNTMDDAMKKRALLGYEKELAWRMIGAHLSREHNLRVSAEELHKEAQGLFLRQAGIRGEATQEQLKELEPFLQKFLGEQKNVEPLYAQLQEEKLLSFLSKRVQLQEESLTFAAFHERIKEKQGDQEQLPTG